MSPEDIPDPSTVNALVCQLMSTYQFRPNDCLQIVKEHRHHKYAGRARMFFESVQQGDGRTGFGAMRMTRGSLSEAIAEAAMPLTVYGICGRRNGCLATRRRALIRIRIARNLGYDRAA